MLPGAGGWLARLHVAQAPHPDRHTHDTVSIDLELGALLAFGEENHPLGRNTIVKHQSEFTNLVVPHEADQCRLDLILCCVHDDQKIRGASQGKPDGAAIGTVWLVDEVRVVLAVVSETDHGVVEAEFLPACDQPVSAPDSTEIRENRFSPLVAVVRSVARYLQIKYQIGRCRCGCGHDYSPSDAFGVGWLQVKVPGTF